MGVLSGDLLSYIAQQSHTYLVENGRPLPSLMILREMYNALKTTGAMRRVNTIRDIQYIVFWGGGDHLPAFRNDWTEIMSDIGDSLTEESKCELLLSFFDLSTVLRSEADYWRRLERTDPHKTYAWLNEALNLAISRIAEKNNAAIRRRHLQELRLPPPAQDLGQQTGRRNGRHRWATPSWQGKVTHRGTSTRP